MTSSARGFGDPIISGACRRVRLEFASFSILGPSATKRSVARAGGQVSETNSEAMDRLAIWVLFGAILV